MYMAGLLLFPAYKTWPKLADRSKWVGLPLMATALIAASFANNVNHLLLTQGVLFALGGSVVYYPALVFVDGWFIERKGLAFGIMWVSQSFLSFLRHFLTLVKGWLGRCRPMHPIYHQLALACIRFPQRAQDMGRGNHCHIRTTDLLSTGTDTTLPGFAASSPRPRIPPNQNVLAPPNGSHHGELGLLHPQHLLADFCTVSWLQPINRHAPCCPSKRGVCAEYDPAGDADRSLPRDDCGYHQHSRRCALRLPVLGVLRCSPSANRI